MLIFLSALLAFLLLPDAAHAGPVFVAALTSASSAFAASSLGMFLSSTVGRLLMSVALSALQASLQERPKPPGIVTETTLTGSTQPLSFTLGLYATGGQLACPPMSHGKAGKTPNAYRTYVVTLGAVPGTKLSRLMLNGEYVDLGTTAHADYGLPVLGRYEGYAWIKYYDGSQTVADPMLRAKYGSDPDRPWTADMVGTGLCYAILTFRFSQSIWTSGEPGWRFELKDTPLYDPRKDSSVGGSGAQRWNNRTTWAGSNNPIVQAYNIFRGIELPGLGVWGGEIPASDLPLSAWFAAMNSADQLVTRPGGATEPRYRAGYEIKVDVEPAAVIEELFKVSATRIAEIGGIWKPRTGGPGLPVYFMTDDDIIVTSPQELDPFPGADQRFNGISTNGPNPAAVWEAEPDPELYNATWEAVDGGKRRMASLDMPACPYPVQRQRIGRAYIKDERRFRIHQLTLPPDAAILEPLDTLGWTSERNGYSTKHFELGDMQDDVPTILQTVSLREVDPTDFTDPPEYGVSPTLIPTTRRPVPAQVLAGFGVLPGFTSDADGTPRRPYIRLIWDGDEQDGVVGIEWQVRLAANEVAVSRGSTTSVEAGTLNIFSGILGATVYQACARQVAAWPTEWTPWVYVTTPDVRLTPNDFSQAIWDAIDAAATAAATEAGLPAVTVLPATGNRLDQLVLKKPEMRLYRWDGSNWVNDLVGNVGNNSITAAKIVAGAVVTAALAANAVTAEKIAANSITAEKIAAGAILAAAVAANAITADKIAAAALTAEKINTASFAASGLALFGGLLKSTNYAAGEAGWQITNAGNAEFNSLTVRESNLAAGSTVVGDGNFTAAALTNNSATAPTTMQTITLTTTGGKVLLQADMSVSGSSGSMISIYRGTTLLIEKQTPGSGTTYTGSTFINFFDAPPAGTHTYTVKLRKFASGSSSVTGSSRSLIAIEFKQAS